MYMATVPWSTILYNRYSHALSPGSNMPSSKTKHGNGKTVKLAFCFQNMMGHWATGDVENMLLFNRVT